MTVAAVCGFGRGGVLLLLVVVDLWAEAEDSEDFEDFEGAMGAVLRFTNRA